MVVKVTKIFQKMKKKSLLSIEKKFYRMRKKGFIMIIRKFDCFIKESIRQLFLLHLYLINFLSINKKYYLFDLQTLQAFSWNIKSFLSLALETCISWNITNFLRVFFFNFPSSESYFLKYKKSIRLESFISRKIRKFRFPKYKKVLRVKAGKRAR